MVLVFSDWFRLASSPLVQKTSLWAFLLFLILVSCIFHSDYLCMFHTIIAVWSRIFKDYVLLLPYGNITDVCICILISHLAETFLICVVCQVTTLVFQGYAVISYAHNHHSVCFQCLCFLCLWPELPRSYSTILVMEGILILRFAFKGQLLTFSLMLLLAWMRSVAFTQRGRYDLQPQQRFLSSPNPLHIWHKALGD